MDFLNKKKYAWQKHQMGWSQVGSQILLLLFYLFIYLIYFFLKEKAAIYLFIFCLFAISWAAPAAYGGSRLGVESEL